MTLRSTNRGLIGLKVSAGAVVLGTAALLTAPQSVQAGIAPDTFMSVEIRDTSQVTLFDSGEVNLQSSGAGNMISGWTYNNPQSTFPALDSALYSSSGFILSRTENGLLPPLLFHNMSYVNETNDTLEFIIDVRMPLTQALNGANIEWIVDSGWNLGGPNNPTVLSLQGMSLFSGFINGDLKGTQGDHPSGFGGGGGQLIFDPNPLTGNMAGPVTELSQRFAFSLSPGATLGIQGRVSVETIPAPAALPLLAIGGLAFGRRRRR